MPNGVSQFGKGIVEQELTRMFEPKWIRAAAKESGLIERERKIDPLVMFWTLAIGYGSQLYRTPVELKREYESEEKCRSTIAVGTIVSLRN